VLRPDEQQLLSHTELTPQARATVQTALAQRAVILDSEPGNGISAGSAGIVPGAVPFYTIPANLTGFVQVLAKERVTRTITNTTTETTLFGLIIGSTTLPSNTLAQASTLRIRMSGMYSTAAVPGNLTIRLKMGATVIASSVITALLVSASNVGWEAEALISCRTAGAGGTVMPGGSFAYATSTASARTFADLTNVGTTSAVDTTVTQQVDLTAQWATASASNTIVTLIATLELLP
jgi:hypothetical protein